MDCRPDCGACCIAPSITSPLLGMPGGKPAGARCVNLDAGNRCLLFGKPGRPSFCIGLQASPEMCGGNREAALAWLAKLERLTHP